MTVLRLRSTAFRHRVAATSVALLTGCAVAFPVPWPVAAVAVVVLALSAAAAHGWNEHGLADAAIVSALLRVVIRFSRMRLSSSLWFPHCSPEPREASRPTRAPLAARGA